MQEQINEKTVALAMRGSKLTARMLAMAMSKLAKEIEKRHHKSVNKIYKGKQTAKQLVSSGDAVSSVEITDQNIKSFEPIARKWGVDFNLYCDESLSPPKWTVLFKAKQADAMTCAFKEFTAKTLKRGVERPSVLDLLRKMKEVVKNQVVDKTRVKEHGGPEL